MEPAQDSIAAATIILDQTVGIYRTAALAVAARAGVADHLDRPRTAAELADMTGMDAASLRRVLRMLASQGIFREDDQGLYHLTPAAGLLRSDASPSLRSAVIMFSEDYMWRSAGHLGDAVREGSSAFEQLYGKPFFEWLGSDPEAASTFHASMVGLSETGIERVIDAYDFPATGTVVDVGGGRGSLLRAILERNRRLNGVLQDDRSALREHVLDTPQTAERWRLEEGSFFDTVPVGGDVYILKHIIHNWGDEQATAILRHCRSAMKGDARVLIIDPVLPDPGTPHFGWALDLVMLSTLTGKERTRQEFEKILNAAGLRIGTVLPVRTLGEYSIIEAVAA
ncbi:methyltransferase [Actinomadura mexicana]|uniref:Hydroxyneurosporene-O-methyltransferase n=1 Tax=Actinomadura mexicana TaxID=134959 RepID=A0A238XBZ3_9ACTN|nr:methyltransferase [Actinomadura mexicana]SNR56595.1 hydroxyneurosporene-O-methyltransferase [Actinomadura mexicana]